MSADNKTTNNRNADLSEYQDIITNYMYIGLLPFFIGAFGPWVFIDQEPFFIRAFLFYSSLILAFLAGSLWIMAFCINTVFITNDSNKVDTSPRNLHSAIIFSLLPLACYFLAPLYATSLMLIGFLLLLLWEKKHINQYYPLWYEALRHKVTFIVIACHMMALLNIIRA